MTSYREIFIATNGPGPWQCYYGPCQILVHLNELHVHHIDENHDNDEPSNLAAVHSLCHQRLHKLGQKHSDAHKRKISEGNRGKTLSAETRAKMSASTRGKPKTEEHKANLSRSLRGRPHSEAARTASFGKVLGPMSEEHKRKIGDANRDKTRSAS